MFKESFKIVFYSLFSICVFINPSNLKGQDIHLSHIHASPTLLNPGMNGLFDKGFLRLIANSRSQWDAITNGYQTAMVSADYKAYEAGSALISAGLNLYHDVAGDLDFTTQQIGLSVGIIKPLDRKQRNLFSIGFQGSYMSNRVNFNKAYTFENDPLIYDYDTPNQIGYFDMSFGTAFFHKLRRYGTVHLGMSLSHINMPDVSFSSRIEEQPGTYQLDFKNLYRKFVIHGGADLRLSKYTSVLPSFIFMDQGPHQEISMGSFLKVCKDPSFKKSPYAFYVGAWVRWYAEHDLVGTDALILSLRTDIKKTKIAFSFDLNLSTLTVASKGAGGPEISIIQIIDSDKRSFRRGKVKCPAM